MEVTLPADLSKQVQQELASGRYRNADELVEQAVRSFLEERDRGERRLAALRRIGQAVDQAGLYERVFLPGQ
ncbi:MAG: type II toxin-antitoxin system ParD family antitoxin [Bryobacterales bacterium]|nr:type II toxin-antitoxin system ParD family antitoxin [Bryobacterales bacterium]